MVGWNPFAFPPPPAHRSKLYRTHEVRPAEKYTTMLPKSTAMDAKAVTRHLQNHILQLCNEHVAYSNKLQILGVLCMTIDDEEQEVVVKVNNTLKRVHPGPQKQQQVTPPLTSTPHGGVGVGNNSNGIGGGGMPASGPSPLAPASETGVVNIAPLSDTSTSSGVSSLSGSGEGQKNDNRRHGRKGKPVKVEQVLDNPAGDTDDEDVVNDDDDVDDEPEATVTVIPCAPSSNASSRDNSATRVNGLDSIVSVVGCESLKRALDTPDQGCRTGSAKRKATTPRSHTPSPAPSHASYTSQASVGKTSPPAAAAANGVDHSLSLPVRLPEDKQGESNQPEDLSIPNKNKSVTPKLKPMNGDLSMSVKSEPSDSYNYSNIPITQDGTPMSVLNASAASDLYANLQQAYIGAIDPQAATITYSGLGLLSCTPPSAMPTMPTGMLAPVTPDDGLSIKYTSNGPYTVGPNGKQVSASSKVKDIILYNEKTPVSEQKGARIEANYMVDKFATDGRKRRRRAAEEMMTQEEVAEYIGKIESSPQKLQCKYCGEQVESVLRYIQHTVLNHQAYICHQCGKSFTTKSSLLRHRPIHTGMRRFACSICKKTFYRKDKCKSHIKRHLGSGEVNLEQYASPCSRGDPGSDASPARSASTTPRGKGPLPVSPARSITPQAIPTAVPPAIPLPALESESDSMGGDDDIPSLVVDVSLNDLDLSPGTASGEDNKDTDDGDGGKAGGMGGGLGGVASRGLHTPPAPEMNIDLPPTVDSNTA